MNARLINAAATITVLGSIYAGCSIAAAVSGCPPPVSGIVLVGVWWMVSGALYGGGVIALAVRRWWRRREVRHLNALQEEYQITYRIGSPPSHAAGRAA